MNVGGGHLYYPSQGPSPWSFLLLQAIAMALTAMSRRESEGLAPLELFALRSTPHFVLALLSFGCVCVWWGIGWVRSREGMEKGFNIAHLRLLSSERLLCMASPWLASGNLEFGSPTVP